MKIDKKKVRQFMAWNHMTVGDVAKAAGLPPQTAAAIICGMDVQPDTLDRIAQALGVWLSDIAQGVELVPLKREPTPLPAGQVRVDTARFKRLMARSGLGVTQLARRAGVTPETVRSLNQGGAHKAVTVDKLAGALGVAADDLIRRGRKA